MRESVNLGFYGLLAGPKLRECAIQPLRAHLYWFGAMQVDKGHRIFVYTCRGNFRATTVESTTTPALIFHWRRTRTFFRRKSVLRSCGLMLSRSRKVPPPPDAEPDYLVGCCVKYCLRGRGPLAVGDKMGRLPRGQREMDGAGNRSRTYDLRITNALLYQLSYSGIFL